MGHKGKVEFLIIVRVEGEAGVWDVTGWGLRHDAPEAAARSRSLRMIFAPYLDFMVGSYCGEIVFVGKWNPLELD